MLKRLHIILQVPKLPKIFTHYSYFISIAPPIIHFHSIVSMKIYHNTGVAIYYLHSRLCLLTTLIKCLTVLLEYIDLLANYVGGKAQQTFGRAWALPSVPFGYTIVWNYCITCFTRFSYFSFRVLCLYTAYNSGIILTKIVTYYC